MEHVARMKGGSDKCTHCDEEKVDTEQHLDASPSAKCANKLSTRK